jgi:CheY-like chemotaxis protein
MDPGTWQDAAVLAEQVLREHLVRPRPGYMVSDRVLATEHFEFRGINLPDRGLPAPAVPTRSFSDPVGLQQYTPTASRSSRPLCRRRTPAMTAHTPDHWRMVVTDDDPQLMAFLVTTLRSAGHCVFAAYDGNSACELALLIPGLDLLITNMRWGSGTNRDLIKAVRANRPGLPILHIGEPMPNPDGLLDDVPALLEPFTTNQLLQKVRELMPERRVSRQV